MKFEIVALYSFCLFCATTHAEEPTQKEETASAEILLTRPKDGAFAKILSSARREADIAPAFTWEQVDGKIDSWFANAKTRFPEEYKKHADNWEKFCEQSKKDARITLSPIEAAWKNSGDKAVDAFEISEKAFYDLKPTILVRGTYRYHEGQRDRSAVKDAWELKSATWQNAARINGADIYDSGDLVLKAAGIELAMFSLRCEWSVSLEASADPNPRKPMPIGAINTPSIWAWVSSYFIVNSSRKIALTWQDIEKTSIKSDVVEVKLNVDSKITSKSEISLSGRYELLDSNLTKPELHAGQNVPSL